MSAQNCMIISKYIYFIKNTIVFISFLKLYHYFKFIISVLCFPGKENASGDSKVLESYDEQTTASLVSF